jgi:hypothetical protein
MMTTTFPIVPAPIEPIRLEFMEWLKGHDSSMPGWVASEMFQAWKEARSRVDWPAHLQQSMARYGATVESVREWPTILAAQFLAFRLEHLKEEMDEIYSSVRPEDVVDGIIDLITIAVGTLVTFGVDTHKAWNAVHSANMRKEPGANPRRPNPFGLPDLIKPPGWVAPDHRDNIGILGRCYYQEKDSTNAPPQPQA